MKKVFEKNETLITILLIVIYVIANSYCQQNFGAQDYCCTLVNTAISLLLISLMIALGRVKYYGIKGVSGFRQYLYFLPLVAIVSVNLWNGININYTPGEILFHVLTMINVGFIEEILFRGFLFKMMEKSNVKQAIIVSALTFGIGHIVNLLNGSDFVPTMMQICYAIAIGFAFVMIFYKSKSLVPCILTHMAINALSIFNIENNISLFAAPAFLVVVSAGYAVYLAKVVREQSADA